MSSIIRICRLAVSYARLTLAEKLALLLSAAAIFLISMLLGAITLLFLLGATAHLLSMAMPIFLAYVIVAAICVVIVLCVYALRRILIFDPFARFISRLIVEQPTKSTDEKSK